MFTKKDESMLDFESFELKIAGALMVILCFAILITWPKPAVKTTVGQTNAVNRKPIVVESLNTPPATKPTKSSSIVIVKRPIPGQPGKTESMGMSREDAIRQGDILVVEKKDSLLRSVYVVKRGDSLWRIAANHYPEITVNREFVEEFATVNEIDNPNLILVGRKLTIFQSEDILASMTTEPTSALGAVLAGSTENQPPETKSAAVEVKLSGVCITKPPLWEQLDLNQQFFFPEFSGQGLWARVVDERVGEISHEFFKIHGFGRDHNVAHKAFPQPVSMYQLAKIIIDSEDDKKHYLKPAKELPKMFPKLLVDPVPRPCTKSVRVFYYSFFTKL